MYSNTSCRENIGIVFFNHFLDNLINPCLISGIKTGFISNQEAEKYYGIVFRKISDELKYLLPKINKQDYKKDYIGEKYCKISKKEIKGALESVDDFKNTSDFHKILLYRSNKNKKVDYYKINNDFILGFQNEILINMYLKY